jgi:hypothetical protein
VAPEEQEEYMTPIERAQRTPSLGLSAEELQRLVDIACGAGQDGFSAGDEYMPAAEATARRLAWEAAAALTAANNRRLMDQLRDLGLLAVAPIGRAEMASPAPDSGGLAHGG